MAPQSFGRLTEAPGRDQDQELRASLFSGTEHQITVMTPRFFWGAVDLSPRSAAGWYVWCHRLKRPPELLSSSSGLFGDSSKEG